MSTTVEKSADTQEDEVSIANNKELPFSERVNAAVKAMKVNGKGVYELPEGLPEDVKVAAQAEKKARDTQAAYTRTSQELAALKAEKTVLIKKATENVTVELTKEQTEELEELKFSDPEAWRKKLNKYEREAKQKQEEIINQEIKEVSTENLKKDEIERREEVLLDFKAKHPNFELNNDIIANDIPPRITKKLEEGNITFEEFVQECYNYLKKDKVIKDDEPPKRPNLGKFGGGSQADENAKAEDFVLSYEKEVY